MMAFCMCSRFSAWSQTMDAGLSNTEARQTLRDTAEDIGLSENEQGYGLLDVGAAVESLGSTDPSGAVSTDGASGVGTDTATLNGTLDDLGGASSADVYFEWRESGGPLTAPPPLERKGFGLRMLERGLAHDLGPGAAVVVRFPEEGVLVTMTFRVGQRSAVEAVPAT